MIDLIINSIGTAGGVALAGIVVDLILRLKPSLKSSGVFQSIGSGLKKVGTLLIKLGELGDKVLPQKIEPQKVEPPKV